MRLVALAVPYWATVFAQMFTHFFLLIYSKLYLDLHSNVLIVPEIDV